MYWIFCEVIIDDKSVLSSIIKKKVSSVYCLQVLVSPLLEMFCQYNS